MVSRDDRGYAPDYVSRETLAYRLDCSGSTVDVYVEKGLLPKPFKLGNLVRWDFAEVREFIKARHAAGARVAVEDEFLKAVRNGQNQAG